MNGILIPDERIINRIYLIRGQKVMIDKDLAELYGVETKRLKEAVRRNSNRFPIDFMFEMNIAEFEGWKRIRALDDEDKMGLRYAPYCFTEQGVTMLSCILHSDQAIEMNIRIIRIFTRMRELVLSHKDILAKIEKMEQPVMAHDVDIQQIFEVLKQLVSPQKKEYRKIGY